MKTVIEMADEIFDRQGPDTHCREPYWTATDAELEQFYKLTRNATLDEIANKIEQDFKGAFGVDTCASWSAWIRNQKCEK